MSTFHHTRHLSDHIVIDNGKLEEISSSKGAHLESLGNNRWCLTFQHGDGSETVMQFTSRDLRMEDEL